MAVEISRQLTVSATPEQVADVLVDLPRWPKWFALHKGWVGDPPSQAVKGTKFKHKVRILGTPGDIEWTVLTAERPTHYQLKGKGSSRTGAEIDFHVTPVPEGSRIDFAAKLSGLALKPFEGMVRPWLNVRVERTVDALRERLDQ